MSRLYDLLPAIYRIRDHAQGEPLRALLAVIEEQYERLEADIQALYDDWFIETCEEWMVPYIGDLLQVRGLNPVTPKTFSQRAFLANTLAYRRRKGTVSVLEQLARDVTGFPAKAVEFFPLLAATQHLAHLRPGCLGCPDLRDVDGLDLVGSPFERAAHTAEVRPAATARGRYNIPNIGLFLWRLESYRFERGDARADGGGAGRFRFHPLGEDLALFNRPQPETGIESLAREQHVPDRLRRAGLRQELDRIRAGGPSGPLFNVLPEDRPFLLFPDGAADAVEPEDIGIADLGTWQLPPSADPNLPVFVDPVLGRVLFPSGTPPARLEVTYSTGFPADLGGGPYDRSDALPVIDRGAVWHVGVSKSVPAVGGESIFTTLGDAILAWNQQPPGTQGIIAVLDSRTYEEDLSADAHIVALPRGSELIVVAAEWPIERANAHRTPGELDVRRARPCLAGSLRVRGTTGTAPAGGKLHINGLLISGAVEVLAGDLDTLHIAHTTLAPAEGTPSVRVHAQAQDGLDNGNLRIHIERSIAGLVRLDDSVPGARIADSVVAAVDGPGTEVSVESSTILGPTACRTLEASDSIFAAPISVGRRQEGCLRFSFVAPGSVTPRRYQCQPELALIERARTLGLPSADSLPDVERQAVLARVRPQFNATRYPHPALAQLGPACSIEIRAGAEDGSEMGAYQHLKQPQREANLRVTLDEYLPLGMEAGIFYAS
jgi:hypothetical protein